jgi:hypothetical protein
VPDSVRKILARALGKKPYQRYADARQMLQAVIQCQSRLLEQAS